MAGRPSAAAPPVALCLGGLDPSAGAGLLRDVMTLAALGIQPMAVCTADTVQNGETCAAIRPPGDPLPCLEALAPHLAPPQRWGVKLGLCCLEERTFAALAARVASLAPAARIWDPILAPTSGVGLHSAAGLRSMASALLASGGWVVCPNLPEAAALAGLPEAAALTGSGPGAGLADLARPLLDLGAEAVWIKGGHGLGPEVEDFWITRSEVLSLGRHPRLPGERRGTGCTLASAWLAWRLLGRTGPEAALAAARFLRERWDPPVRPGSFGRPCFAPGAP